MQIACPFLTMELRTYLESSDTYSSAVVDASRRVSACLQHAVCNTLSRRVLAVLRLNKDHLVSVLIDRVGLGVHRRKLN